MTEGWLKRGLENAVRETDQWSPQKKEALQADSSFSLMVSEPERQQRTVSPSKVSEKLRDTKEYTAEDISRMESFADRVLGVEVCEDPISFGLIKIVQGTNRISLSIDQVPLLLKALTNVVGISMR
jgi:hypothetical protein